VPTAVPMVGTAGRHRTIFREAPAAFAHPALP